MNGLQFYYHDSILREIKSLERKHKTVNEALKTFERLCDRQFNPLQPEQVISPGKLHRIQHTDLWALWKVELVLPRSGLRPNQFPRLWFAVKGSHIVFLCIYSHIDNYSDNEIKNEAIKRISDFF
ncbi:MAG: hypothetical protein ACD_62C00036G0006 [uncultured bacterium]|nr:MAG: hypothetical protein ACD_62C00036G0006 [uncultured bacterium]